MELTKHIKTRIDDSHAPPGTIFNPLLNYFLSLTNNFKNIVSFSGKM